MAISIIPQGDSGKAGEVAGTTFRSTIIATKPLDYSAGTFGHYAFGGITGILAAALGANSEVFQFRWTDAYRLAVISRIHFSACVSTTFFAAGVPVQIDLVKSTQWTVPGTGGTGISPANILKKRSSMGASFVSSGDIRISTTSALGAGTKNLDGNSLAFAAAPGPITTSLNGQIFPPNTTLWEADTDSGSHPIILMQNEGISIRSVAVPATGTWTIALQINWAEVPSY